MKTQLDTAWIQTFTGQQFFLFDPSVVDICIEDIAHALANIGRFGGHTYKFYSVAQHSIRCAELAKPEHQLAMLLHDAAEAYIGDMVTPLKRTIPAFQEAEDRLLSVIAEKFGVSFDFPELAEIDGRVLATERRDLLNHSHLDWNLPYPAYPFGQLNLHPLPPDQAEYEFLKFFNDSYGT